MADGPSPADESDPAVAETHASEPGSRAAGGDHERSQGRAEPEAGDERRAGRGIDVSSDGAARAERDASSERADSIASSDTHAAVTARIGRIRSIRPGDKLGANGRYEIGDELGEGGMATVFEARDTQLRRPVAIKVLFPHLAKRDEIVRRFQREARAAAGLEHPNILRIYDVGGAEGDDPPYIVMEIVRGRSLLQEIEQRGAMFPEIVACVGALLADALAAAHAAAIVHRDIKPANVMIAANGRLLLTDFGVARLETEDSSLVTKTGALLGTPAYMSPEQASGDTATAKSDLYSLGATLYQLATGALPYAGSPAKVLAQIASGALVAPAKKKPGVGPDLSRAIEQLMRTEPEQRTASAAQVASELRALVATAGFGEPADELAAYFADPAGFVAARTPKVLAAVIAAAEAALVAGTLPRAMALADRASVLAPADPAVQALIDRVAAGGRASGRRRTLAIVAAALAVAAAGTIGALRVLGGSDAAPDAAVVATIADADAGALAVADADTRGSPDADTRGAPDVIATVALDASVPIGFDAAAPVAHDAAASGPRDAGAPRDPRTTDAAIVRVRPDAGARTPPDGALAALPTDAPLPLDAALVPLDAAPSATTGTVIVKNNKWCYVFVDGTRRGQATNTLRLELSLGQHTITCSQESTTAGFTWTRQVDVTPGEQTVQGAFDLRVTIHLEVATTIDDRPYPAGADVTVQRGRVKIGRAFRDITVPCTVRADLQCEP